MNSKYLFYISQNYSFEILRPLQTAIRQAGDECAWFVDGEEVNREYLREDEKCLPDVKSAIDYGPTAVFVPGNVVPDFIPGLKVQVFHGLEYKKKGHFRIRGFFDLYCPHGALTTGRFQQMADELGYFNVIETGWPKLDPLFTTAPYPLQTDKPVVLFAPTFSPNLTCALDCLDAIKAEVATNECHWLAKFHPKMNPDWIDLYRQIDAENFDIVETDSALPLLQRADVMLSDTSSMVGEFLLLNKPVITYNNSDPGDYLIDIQSPTQLHQAINRGLSRETQLMQNIEQLVQQLHPYQDGQSSQRVLKAVEDTLPLVKKLRQKKPLNLIRSLKLRKKLGYWRL